MRRWVFAHCLFVLAGCTAGCPGGSAPPAGDAGPAGAADAGVGVDGGGFGDAGSGGDAGSPGGFQLLACLGVAAPLQGTGQLPYTAVTVAGVTGAFLLDVGSTGSWIDLAAYPSGAPVPTSCSSGSPTVLGQTCTFPSLEFFGPWGPVGLITANFSSFGTSPRQAGLLGTDFLSVHAFTLDFTGRRVLRGAEPGFCSDAELSAAGFGALSTAGFFSDRPATLRAMSTVRTGSGAGTVPNVPTVPLRIAGVTALAQLDTGFDDRLVPHSVNVNEAFYAALVAGAPTALVRDDTVDLTLTTCVVGLSESVTGYRLAPGVAAELMGASGVAVRSEPGAVLFVKHPPAGARTCGGIGTWTVPAAQVAASFFVEAGAVVFDPLRSTVWMPRR